MQHTLSFELEFDSSAECVLAMGMPYTVTDLESDLTSIFAQPERARWAKLTELVKCQAAHVLLRVLCRRPLPEAYHFNTLPSVTKVAKSTRLVVQSR